MTPERKAWWDSLSAEEKCVRIAIKKEKSYMSFYKSDGALNIRGFIKYHKLLIKALRKQIAMRPRPWSSKKFLVCPCCRKWVYEQTYCKMCGQKLRWK